jgi:hypothetical protein
VHPLNLLNILQNGAIFYQKTLTSAIIQIELTTKMKNLYPQNFYKKKEASIIKLLDLNS